MCTYNRYYTGDNYNNILAYERRKAKHAKYDSYYLVFPQEFPICHKKKKKKS